MGLGETPAYVEISMLLKCRVCERDLDAEEHFYPRKGTRTGYQYECKDCRRKINKKYEKTKRERERQRREAKKEVPKSKSPPRGQSETPQRKKSRNHRGEHRKKLLESAGKRISDGELIAETPRSMTFNLSLIIEQQLRMFYGRQITSALNRPRMNQVLDDTLFEIKQALGRAGKRMQPLTKAEEVPTSLDVSLEKIRKEADARSLLGVTAKASGEEIKKAYRAKAREAHPDHNGSTEAMQKLNEAFSLLEGEPNGK